MSCSSFVNSSRSEARSAERSEFIISSRAKRFHNKISIYLPVCSTWPCGKAMARCVEGPEFDSGHNHASFLFLSFSVHFRYNSFVMFLYIADKF